MIEKQIKQINILILIVYILFILPYIRQSYLIIFGNIFLRLLIIGIIILAGIYDTLLSILLAIAFIFTHLKFQKINNNNLSYTEKKKIDNFINKNKQQ